MIVISLKTDPESVGGNLASPISNPSRYALGQERLSSVDPRVGCEGAETLGPGRTRPNQSYLCRVTRRNEVQSSRERIRSIRLHSLSPVLTSAHERCSGQSK